MSYTGRCLFLLLLGLTLGLCLAPPSQAAPSDRDYETLAPISRPVMATPPKSTDPVGLVGSPLAIADVSIRPHQRMRFVLRDRTALVGEVLGFDGQMYALHLPHSTILARKDLFIAVSPVQGHLPPTSMVRPVRTVHKIGARY